MTQQRAVLYGRISRERGRLADGTLRSNVQQEDETTGKAKAMNARVVSWDLDMDVSGGLFRRKGFQRALDMFESREADVMIVPALDRFGRDMKVIYKALDIIESNGGYLVSVKDNIEDSRTEHGRQQIAMYGLFAQTQLDRLKSGWKWAHAAHVADGISHRDCYGYDRDERRVFTPNPDESPNVVRMFELRASEMTFSDVARALNALDQRTRNGRRWSASSVEAIVRNRNYLGEVRWKDEENLEAHPPLVTPELFHAAQGARRVPRPASNAALLSGLVRCSGCRYRMQFSPGPSAQYRCKARHTAGRCPAPVNINATQIETHIRDFLTTVPADDELVVAGADTDEAALIEAVHLWEGRVADIMGDEELMDLWGKEEYKRRLKAARVGLADAQAALAARDKGRRVVIDAEAFDRLPLDARRRVLADTLDCIFVRGQPGRATGGRLVPIDGRVHICEIGLGPKPEDLPRRGDAGASYVMRPFPFPDEEAVAGV